MTRFCPRPVDWLDYLDGVGEPALGEHLVDCLSCQAAVASLQAQAPASIPSNWSATFEGRTDAVWHEDRPAQPAPAEFWFSASNFDLDKVAIDTAGSSKWAPFSYHSVDRVLVLVLSHPEEDHAGWLDVVPVLSDVEAATETDLLFSEQENSLGAPWRALFAHQLKVARRQLDTRVGSLSDLGASALFAAIAGEADEARWGVPTQHPDDPRARLEDELEEALTRLRTPWLLIHHADDCFEQTDHAGSGLRLAPPEPPTERLDERSKHADVFWLTPISKQQHEFALAAASAPTPRRDLWALDHEAIRLAGKLAVDWAKGVLIFVIGVARVADTTRVRLHVIASGKEYASEPFVPLEGITVPLAEHVTTAQVEQLGAEVMP